MPEMNMGKIEMMNKMIINLQIHIIMIRLRILMMKKMTMERQGKLRKQ